MHKLSNHSKKGSSVYAVITDNLLIYSFALCSISKIGDTFRDGDESNQLESRLAIIIIIIGTGTSMSVYILTNDWYLCEVVLRIIAVRERF